MYILCRIEKKSFIDTKRSKNVDGTKIICIRAIGWRSSAHRILLTCRGLLAVSSPCTFTLFLYNNIASRSLCELVLFFVCFFFFFFSLSRLFQRKISGSGIFDFPYLGKCFEMSQSREKDEKERNQHNLPIFMLIQTTWNIQFIRYVLYNILCDYSISIQRVCLLSLAYFCLLFVTSFAPKVRFTHVRIEWRYNQCKFKFKIKSLYCNVILILFNEAHGVEISN